MRWVYLIILVFSAGIVQANETQLSFTRGGYWLTNPAPDDIALHQEQVDENGDGYAKARLTLYKLSDPTLLAEIVTARELKSLNEVELLRRVTQTSPVWQGDLVLPKTGDSQVPIAAIADKLGEGVYVVTAAIDNNESQRVAQWFVRSSMMIKAQFLPDRAFVAGYNVQTRTAYSDVHLRWCDANGKIVSEEELPETGAALIQHPANAALLIAMGTKSGSFDFVPVPAADKFHKIDGALIYPSAAHNEPGKPFSFLVAVSGEPAPTLQLNDADLPALAIMPGLWRADVPTNKTGALTLTVQRDNIDLATSIVPAVASSKLVINWIEKPKVLITLQPTNLKFRLMSGGKALTSQEGVLVMTREGMGANSAVRVPFRIDAKGIAAITVPADSLPAIAARYQVTIDVANQQTIDSSSMISAYPAQNWLDIKPQFSEGAVAENVTAQFTVTNRHAEGGGQAVPVNYELAREAYKFEWYQAEDGRWAYRTKTTLEKVLEGKAQPLKGVTNISVPVSAGRYRLIVKETNGALQGVQSFTAGWWLAQSAPTTPQTIELSAQVEGDVHGTDDKSHIAIFIDPPFAAHVWVAAINARSGAALPMVDVPDEGGFAYLPRSTLQPGQPLLLAAYGIPSDASASLIQAEGATILPLGSKIDLQILPTNKGDGATLYAQGLPVDQPLDKNIAQAFIALYDDVNQSLWQTAKLAIDTAGKAQIDFKTTKIPTRMRARIFSTAGERLNVSEQVLMLGNKTAINK